MSDGSASVALSDLREAVGIHFFMWSSLERAVKQAVSELETDGPSQTIHGIARTIDRWRQLHNSAANRHTSHLAFIEEVYSILTEGLVIRNRLAHGICGWSVETRCGSDAFIETEMNNERKTVTLTALISITEQLGFVASSMSRITGAALHSERIGIENIYSDIRRKL